MSNKLISIIGPTAVGKTSFLLKLIDYLNTQNSGVNYDSYNLISADSRQVYKDLMIISGADVPSDFVRQNETNEDTTSIQYFEKDNLRLYGLLDLNYQDEWSLAHFKKFAQTLIKQSWKENRLPIIVGGTGLYHEYLFNDSSTIGIGPNNKLRKELSSLSLSELQQRLEEVDKDRFEKMNNSDQNNPVRLIRAIEVEKYYQDNPGKKDLKNNSDHQYGERPDYDHLTIGLTDDLKTIEEKILKRVKERFDNGAIAEVENVMSKIADFGLNKQITTATGVKEIQSYLDEIISKEECLEKWSLREYQYAKRQLTWWRHRKNINWFEINEDNWQKSAFDRVIKFILPEQK
jgi:tRNA dimethylallyltransferase